MGKTTASSVENISRCQENKRGWSKFNHSFCFYNLNWPIQRSGGVFSHLSISQLRKYRIQKGIPLLASTVEEYLPNSSCPPFTLFSRQLIALVTFRLVSCRLPFHEEKGTLNFIDEDEEGGHARL